MDIPENKYPDCTLEDNYKKALTELVLLYLLSKKECYITELTDIMREKSQGVIDIVFPYGAIYRLEEHGHIVEERKRIAPDGRRRQYLRITESGRDYLKHLMGIYRRCSGAFADILEEEDSNLHQET